MRYIVFAYCYYYPLGGARDVQLVTDSQYEAWDEFVSLRDAVYNLGLSSEPRWDVVEVFDTFEERVIYSANPGR